MPHRVVIISLVVLALLGVGAYATSLLGQFVWDDTLLIGGNKHITSLRHIPAIFREDLFHMSDLPTGYYRPVQVLSYMADYLLWGKLPFGYHLTGIILQIINAWLVFWLSFLVLGERWRSLFVAAVFCVHPAFVPIVGYISGRADLLGICFALLAIVCVIRYAVTGRSVAALSCAVPCYALALLSKEYYILAPLFILLYLVVNRKDAKPGAPAWIATGMMACVAIAYLLLRATVLNFHQEMGVIAQQPFSVRLAIFPWIIKNYLMTLVAPVDLYMEKQLAYRSFTEGRFVLSWIVPALVAWLLWRYHARQDRLRLFLVGWFALAIIPVANLLFALKAIWADHWVYMASIGFFGYIASLTLTRPGGAALPAPARRALAVAGCVYVIFLGALTVRENRHWHAELALYDRILQKSPDSARTIYNQGKVYEERGDIQKALERFDRAIELSSGGKAMYYNSRGMLHKNLGNREKARADFEAAVRQAPNVAIYHNNLGCVYAELGRIDDARREWEAALAIDPRDELSRRNLEVAGWGGRP